MNINSKRMIKQIAAESEAKYKNPDEKFLRVAREVSRLSTCVRFGKRNGAVIVLDNQIIATGCNGAPNGVKTCLDRGYCMRKKLNIESGTQLEVCYALHAEETALMNAAREGVVLEGATMYVLRKPCISCLKLILNAGIKKVVYVDSNFDNEVYKDILNQVDIEFVQIPFKVEDDVWV